VKTPTIPRDVNWREFFVEQLIRLAGASSIGFVLLIFLFLIREGAPALLEVPLSNLVGQRWYPTFDIYGLAPLVLGSLLVTVGAIAISLPLGVAAALFIGEIAPEWVREILKPAIEIIAGIPSVVIGFVGIQVVSPLVREFSGAPTGLTALPTIISIAEDALDSVPESYRHAAYALSATQWQTIWRVVLPAARPGIVTAVMLGVGRAIGETMTVMMVAGNAARMPLGLDAFLRPVRTMTATIAAEMGEVARGSTHYHVLFVVGLVLFLLTFVINLAGALTIFRRGRGGGGRFLA